MGTEEERIQQANQEPRGVWPLAVSPFWLGSDCLRVAPEQKPVPEAGDHCQSAGNTEAPKGYCGIIVNLEAWKDNPE